MTIMMCVNCIDFSEGPEFLTKKLPETNAYISLQISIYIYIYNDARPVCVVDTKKESLSVYMLSLAHFSQSEGNISDTYNGHQWRDFLTFSFQLHSLLCIDKHYHFFY